MLNGLTNRPLENVRLYLSVEEARILGEELRKLLADPEASEHCHVFSRDMEAELSVSIVTVAKLATGGYTAAERALLR